MTKDSEINYMAIPGIVGEKDEFDELLKKCCSAFNVSVHEVKGKNRTPKYSFPRKAFCLIMRKSSKLTLGGIGNYINRDHSVVSFLLKKAEDHIEVGDEAFANGYNKLIEND